MFLCRAELCSLCVGEYCSGWLSRNGVGHINKVTLCQAGLILRWVNVQPSHPGQLSLVIPPWVGEISTNDGYGYCHGRKRRVLRNSRPCDQDCWHTDWLKALAANWAGHLVNLYAGLIGFHPRRLKSLQGMSSIAMDLDLCGIFYRRVLVNLWNSWVYWARKWSKKIIKCVYFCISSQSLFKLSVQLTLNMLSLLHNYVMSTFDKVTSLVLAWLEAKLSHNQMIFRNLCWIEFYLSLHSVSNIV